MSGARDRILKANTGKKQAARKLLGDQSGAPPTGSRTSSPVPAAALTSPGAMISTAKRIREPEVLDLTREQEKGRYELPPCHIKKDFFSSASLALPDAELVHLEGLDRPSKRAQLAADASAMVRVLGMAFVYAEEGSSQERELRKLKEDHAALAAKLKTVEEEKAKLGKENELYEKEKGEWVGEKKKLAAALDSSIAERGAAENLIEKLRAQMAPSADETDEQKALKTRADLIARINQGDEDSLAVVEEVFASAIEQVKVANPGVELNLEGVGSANSVVDGQIVVPDFMIEDRQVEQPVPQGVPAQGSQ